MDVYKCIYCNSDGPYSEEHALSRNLGEFRGFPLLLNRICKKCNENIGKLEEQFGRSGPEAFMRQYLNIEGRDAHDKVNPFQRGSAGAKPIDVTAPSPENGINILWEFNKDGTVREVRQIVFIDGEGNSYPIRINSWMKNSQQIREEAKKIGIDVKGKKAHIFASDQELEWVESLVKGLGNDLQWLPKAEPATIKDPIATVTVTDFYFRAVAKIGFHYFLSTSDAFRGNESYFNDIREFIIKGGEYKKFVTQTFNPILAFPPGLGPVGWGHVLLVENTKGFLEARLQFFIGPKLNPPVYLIRLSDENLPCGDQGWQGHYFAYFSSGKQGRFLGEVSALQPVLSSAL